MKANVFQLNLFTLNVGNECISVSQDQKQLLETLQNRMQDIKTQMIQLKQSGKQKEAIEALKIYKQYEVHIAAVQV